MRVFWRVSLFQPPPNRQLSIPHAQHSAESRGRFVRCTLDSRPTTFHRQNISYLHSAWMYGGPEHHDNRGNNTHPVRDRHKPNTSTCGSRQWALHYDEQKVV